VSADLTSDGKLFQARRSCNAVSTFAETETTSGRPNGIVGRAQGDLAVESGDGL